jgi:NAD-dependent deacetylase
MFESVVPNKSHVSLADAEKEFSHRLRELSIITQNVDGLHIRAGSKKVTELHGRFHSLRRHRQLGLVQFGNFLYF